MLVFVAAVPDNASVPTVQEHSIVTADHSANASRGSEDLGHDLAVENEGKAVQRMGGPTIGNPSPGACIVTRTTTYSRQYALCGHDIHADTVSRWKEATFMRTYVKCPGEGETLYRTDFVRCNGRRLLSDVEQDRSDPFGQKKAQHVLPEVTRWFKGHALRGDLPAAEEPLRPGPDEEPSAWLRPLCALAKTAGADRSRPASGKVELKEEPAELQGQRALGEAELDDLWVRLGEFHSGKPPPVVKLLETVQIRSTGRPLPTRGEGIKDYASQSSVSSSRDEKKTKKEFRKSSFWSIAFPIYYVLLSFTCNVLFLVGSFLFLPIKSQEASVSFTFVVENIDVDQVMTSNSTLFQLLNIMSSEHLVVVLVTMGSEGNSEIRSAPLARQRHFQWRKTTSCSLDQAMLFDVNIYPRDGWFSSPRQMSMPSVASLSTALNQSFSANTIDELATGEPQVNIVTRPRLMKTAVVQKWAVDFGCTLFIIGSALLAAISALDLLEDMLTCGSLVEIGLKLPSPKTLTQGYEFVAWKLHSMPVGSEPEVSSSESHVFVSARLERLMYLSGGLIFLVGTFYFQHPQMVSSRVPSEVMHDEDVLFMAIWMFIIGSIVFVFATFLNALSLNASGKTFIHWAVATCGIYELGGILFVMGSVCFMPNQGAALGSENAWRNETIPVD
ncbi:unnamed protein product [Durusdinium trenchii]|uniref:Uncharacterized protein n=1 Tax=Durusdinium trenchii TaxID=1381693 RepID=A0ABP0JRA4_9DINO